MNSNEYFEILDSVTKDRIDLMKRKSKDYASNENIFKNFEVRAESLKNNNIFNKIRVCDVLYADIVSKVVRLGNIISKDNKDINFEGVLDTLKDLQNYVDLSIVRFIDDNKLNNDILCLSTKENIQKDIKDDKNNNIQYINYYEDNDQNYFIIINKLYNLIVSYINNDIEKDLIKSSVILFCKEHKILDKTSHISLNSLDDIYSINNDELIFHEDFIKSKYISFCKEKNKLFHDNDENHTDNPCFIDLLLKLNFIKEIPNINLSINVPEKNKKIYIWNISTYSNIYNKDYYYRLLLYIQNKIRYYYKDFIIDSHVLLKSLLIQYEILDRIDEYNVRYNNNFILSDFMNSEYSFENFFIKLLEDINLVEDCGNNHCKWIK